MTLILTCLTHDFIVQAADRRLTLPDGSVFDDDTNKALFYCGRSAIAYTGLARLDSMDTSEWLAHRLADANQIAEGLSIAATAAAEALGRQPYVDPRLAFVSAGWATREGEPSPLPFVCAASNFMSEGGDWLDQVQKDFALRVFFLDETESLLLFIAGQCLSEAETASLSRALRRCVERGLGPGALAQLLGREIRRIAAAGGTRGARVGPAHIIQSLSRVALGINATIVTPLTRDAHSFLYVARDGSTDRFQGPILVSGGTVLMGVGGGTIRPGGKGRIRQEMEDAAQQEPILLGEEEADFLAACPFCVREGTTTEVRGELPIGRDEVWVYCKGSVGHLLLVRRR